MIRPDARAIPRAVPDAPRPGVPAPDAPAPPRGLPRWVTRLARSRLGIGALSMMESTVAPLPFEAILAPLMIAHPRQSWGIALAAWLGSVIGAALFYVAGLWLYEPVVAPALAALGLEARFEEVRAGLAGGGSFFAAVLLISASPVPVQLATLGAGAVGGPLPLFLAAIALSRGARYFGLALLAGWLGHRLERMRVRRRWVALGTLVALAAGWLALQFLT